MTVDTQHHRDHTFWIGLFAGTLVGAGLVMWLDPRTSGLGQRMTDTARDLGTSASEHYRQARTRVDEAVDEVTKRGQSLRHDVARTIVHGAREAERIAAAIDAPAPTPAVKS